MESRISLLETCNSLAMAVEVMEMRWKSKASRVQPRKPATMARLRSVGGVGRWAGSGTVAPGIGGSLAMGWGVRKRRSDKGAHVRVCGLTFFVCECFKR